MKIKSPIGFLALWSAFLAVGTWMLPVGLLLASPSPAIATTPPDPVEPAGSLQVTGEYVLNREGAITETDLVRAHTQTFKALFDAEWDPSHWTYPIAEPVNRAGRYMGRNELNLEYTISIVQWTPLSLDTVAMPAEQREALRKAGVSFASVMAVLATAKARVHMFGVVSSQRSLQGDLAWSFMPTYFADPGHPLYSDMTVALDQGTVDSEEGFREGAPRLPSQRTLERAYSRRLLHTTQPQRPASLRITQLFTRAMWQTQSRSRVATSHTTPLSRTRWTRSQIATRRARHRGGLLDRLWGCRGPLKRTRILALCRRLPRHAGVAAVPLRDGHGDRFACGAGRSGGLHRCCDGCTHELSQWSRCRVRCLHHASNDQLRQRGCSLPLSACGVCEMMR